MLAQFAGPIDRDELDREDLDRDERDRVPLAAVPVAAMPLAAALLAAVPVVAVPVAADPVAGVLARSGADSALVPIELPMLPATATSAIRAPTNVRSRTRDGVRRPFGGTFPPRNAKVPPLPGVCRSVLTTYSAQDQVARGNPRGISPE